MYFKDKYDFNFKEYIINMCFNIYNCEKINTDLLNNIELKVNDLINYDKDDENEKEFNKYEYYHNTILEYSKINGIDHIMWINLDRDIERKNYMENILKNINISNTRIPAIDGNNNDFSNCLLINKNLTNSEIGCSLSHIYAISYLKTLPGNYFLVCEDDISLDNLFFIDKSIKEIINNAPKFDILILSKIFYDRLPEIYTKWTINNGVGGTACYIISREGIEKFTKIAYLENTFILNEELTVADNYIYKFLDTYIYKYDYITTTNESSSIHPDHLNMQILLTQIQKIYLIEDLIK
jgi:GR25 family glycosyltransferase involved in LPS biosynthesis